MKVILIGHGEIGKGVKEYYGKYFNIDVYDLTYQKDEYEKEYDIMLVTIPYADNFVDIVKEYQGRFNPKATIIFSTVAIGTTSQIDNAVHVPIEGKHPHLAESIGRWQVIMGGHNEIAVNFFEEANKEVIDLKNSEITEALKLLSTSFYGHILEYFRYAESVLQSLGGDYNNFNFYNYEYNKLYESMNMNNFTRPELTPPKGNLGGHCVTPNSIILDKQFPSIYLKEIYRDKEAE